MANGNLRFNSGQLFNLLARARSLTFSSALGDYPGLNAVDGDAGKPWITEGEATEAIEADLAGDDYGAMEAFPAGWTADHSGTQSGSGADAVNFHGGAKSAKLLAGSAGVAQYYLDETVAAGEERRLITALKITSASGTVRNRVQCLETGRWLAPDGTWQDAPVDVFSSASTSSWDVQALTFRVESFEETGLDAVTVRRFIRCEDDCTANVDDFMSWPTWDVLSLHGHNADASQAITVFGGDTSPASTLVATFDRPVSKPGGYVRTSDRQTYRYFRMLLPAENLEAFHAGEIVLWQSRVATWGWLAQRRIHKPLHVGGPTLAGRASRARLGTPPRTYSLDFHSTDGTTEAELLGEMWLRPLEGIHPGVLIPDDEESDVVFGRAQADELTSTPMVTSSIRTFTLAFVEDGLPTVGL